MKRKDILTHEFDVVIKDSRSVSVPASCLLTLPIAGWDAAIIELSIPHALMPTPALHNPCTVEGHDRFGRTIKMTEVWYRELPMEAGRKAGSSPVVLSHVGHIICTHFFAPEVDGNSTASTLRVCMAKHEFLRVQRSRNVTYEHTGQTEDLFTLEIDGAGTVQFIRHWSFAGASDDYESQLKCSLQAVIKFESDKPPSLVGRKEVLTEALLVPSVLSRQRLHVVGWKTQGVGLEEQVWQNPLAPLQPKYAMAEPQAYLVLERDFADIANHAIFQYQRTSQELRKVLLHMAVGLAPYLEYGEAEHFLVMFHALEACRKFATQDVPPEVKAENADLLAILSDVKLHSTPQISLRLQGYMSTVEKGKLSLAMQLRQVLGTWGVYLDDLWPLSGNSRDPGLKDIRDVLSHTGSIGVNPQGLAVASWHLRVLLERVFIALLGIPLEKTSVSLAAIQVNPWCLPSFVQEQRKRVFQSH